MSNFVRQHKGAVAFSVVFHVAIVGMLVLNLRLPSWQQPVAPAVQITGTMIDESALEREQQRRDEVKRQETQRRQREERQKQAAEDAAKQAAEQRQRDQQEAARREQQRVAVERQKTEQAERDRQEVEKRRQEQVAREKREREEAEQRARVEAEQRARADAEKRAQEQRARQQAEAELAEQARAEQRAAADLAEYVALIQSKIERNWVKPASAQPGLNCIVKVFQIPSGDVMDVQVASCNGDAAVVASIERAVRNASPLPKPSNPTLFRRNLDVVFQPDL
jgi:colicin import membrane protein